MCLFQGIPLFLSGSGWALSRSCFGMYAHKTVLTGAGKGIYLSFLLQGIPLLRSWLGVMVHMLRHYMHETPLAGGRRYI